MDCCREMYVKCHSHPGSGCALGLFLANKKQTGLSCLSAGSQDTRKTKIIICDTYLKMKE